MKTITVHVTFEDIARGERADCRRCPIARAVGRHFPNAQEIVATSGRIDVIFPEEIIETDGTKLRMYRAYTPAEAYRFMEAYDADEEVPVFRFDLVFYPHITHTPPTRTVL